MRRSLLVELMVTLQPSAWLIVIPLGGEIDEKQPRMTSWTSAKETLALTRMVGLAFIMVPTGECRRDLLIHGAKRGVKARWRKGCTKAVMAGATITTLEVSLA